MGIEAHPRRSDVVSGSLLALHFGVVFAPIYMIAVIGPGWMAILAWLWFGLLIQGALLSLHEAAHKMLFKSVSRNEFVAHWLLAPLFMADFDAFRQRHWQHHRELGQDGDPKYTYRMNVSGWRFPLFVLSTLTLFEGVRRSIYQSGKLSGSTAESGKQALIAIFVTQTVFFLSVAVVAWFAHPDSWQGALWSLATAYGFVYLYGLASLGVLMIALRGIVEHRPLRPDEPRQGGAALRNFENGFRHLSLGMRGIFEGGLHFLMFAIEADGLVPVAAVGPDQFCKPGAAGLGRLADMADVDS